MNLKELYQEIILDHGKNPRNLRKTENFNKDAKGHNPLCGDKVHIYLKLSENKKVEDISFEGEGCAISMASASIMTDLLRGKEENDFKFSLIQRFYLFIERANTILRIRVHVLLVFTESKFYYVRIFYYFGRRWRMLKNSNILFWRCCWHLVI